MTTTEDRRTSMRALLTIGRTIATVLLLVPYALGWIAGVVVAVALATATAARLGWSDARKG
jgi:hypothetical protein